MTHRAIAAVLFLACVAFAGCIQSFVAARDESHPAGGRYLASATIDLSQENKGYYSTAVTIRNVTQEPLTLKPEMFRLEGTAPTAFDPAGRMPLFFWRAGYRMPEVVEPSSTAQGEVFFRIRGTPVPVGPVRLVVTLPDGVHSFEFDLLQ